MQRKTHFKIIALLLGVGFALLALEVIVRLAGPPEKTKQALHYRDEAGQRVDGPAAAAERGIIYPLMPPRSPRKRFAFKAGSRFFICYDNPTGDWFDENGCVPVRFNSSGIREREEIGFDKPPGQRRIVCLGDSFTFGWGIREEDGWVRLLENALRVDDDTIRTVNCGAAGTTVVDEYRYGLEKRFHRFGPDLVLVTLCLNDLIPKNAGVGLVRPPPDTPSALLNRILLATRDPLELDPEFDWVGFLLGLGPDDPLYTNDSEVDYDMLWASNTPQQNLVLMRDWCAARDIRLGVVVWPFLQGLGADQHYPFESLHDQVGAFCAAENIPFHDVLPSLRGHDPKTLWVHPTDWHANPIAQRLALPGIEAFVREIAPW